MNHLSISSYANRELKDYTHQWLSQNQNYDTDLPNLDFVYDRTEHDVKRVIELTKKYQSGKITDAEKAEWESDLKGALNASDLNRNEYNITSIADVISVEVEKRLGDWTAEDKPHPEDYERIRGNVQKIRDGWIQIPNAIPVPDRPLNTYQKWNDIEKILFDIYAAYKNIIGNYIYCDTEIYAGEGIGTL